MRARQETRPLDMLQGANPVTVIMGAALLIILGILIIIFPPLLHWVVGIGLIVAGVGAFTMVVTPSR